MLLPTIALLLQSAVSTPPPPDYWGSLSPGPHSVGFTQRWVIDSTRRLAGDTTGLGFRPVLLNLWYPARASARARMPYRDYFAGARRAAGGNGALRRYADALVQHHEGVARSELLGGVPDSLLPAAGREVDALFSAPAAAQRDARRIGGTLPVVVYTGGAGSSYDDNVLLCEYLASRGYLVVGSAYPSEDNNGFRTAVDDDSRPRDIRRLIFELTRIQGLATGRVVAIGHSAGAQALQLSAADPSAPMDAVLSLDTTQDYAMLTDDSWRYYTDALVRRRQEVRIPIVFFADRSALFTLADSLANSDRWLVTVPDLGHNDFISQGNLKRRAVARAGGPADDGRLHRTHEALLRFTGAWLDWFNAGATTTAPSPESPLALTRVAKGEKSPRTDARSAQSAREFRHLYGISTPGEFAEAFIRGTSSQAPGAHRSVLMMLLVDDIRRGQATRARSFYQAALARDSSLASVRELITARVEMFESFKATDLASEWRRLLEALDGR